MLSLSPSFLHFNFKSLFQCFVKYNLLLHWTKYCYSFKLNFWLKSIYLCLSYFWIHHIIWCIMWFAWFLTIYASYCTGRSRRTSASSPLGGRRSLINRSEWRWDTQPEPDRPFLRCADANSARPSLTSALFFSSFCSVHFIFNFFLSCANKVGFTKADLQGRRSNSASSKAPSPESLLCAMHCGCHHGNYISLFLVQQRSPAPWGKKDPLMCRETEGEEERCVWYSKLKKPFVTKVLAAATEIIDGEERSHIVQNSLLQFVSIITGCCKMSKTYFIKKKTQSKQILSSKPPPADDRCTKRSHVIQNSLD